MLKHFLWFSRYPADEREAVILSVAYQRALTVAWAGLGVFLFVVKIGNADHAVAVLQLLLLASMAAGWTAVRYEHLEFKPVVHEKRIAFWKFAAVLFVATLAGMLPVLWRPELLFASIVGVFIIHVISAMVWAWNWTRAYTLHARMLAILLTSLPTIGFLLWPKIPFWKRVLTVFLMMVGAVAVPIAMWVPFMGTVAMPGGFGGPIAIGYEQNEEFLPAVFDYRLVGGIAEGDLIMFGPQKTVDSLEYSIQTQLEQNFLYGRVLAVDNDVVTVEVLDAISETSDSSMPDITTQFRQHHTEQVALSRVFAKVITNAPLANWLLRE